MHNNDFLWRHLKGVPAFRALLRAVESRFYQDLSLPEPVLDLGCGDGHFSQQTFIDSRPPLIGVDPWWRPLQEAHQRQLYGLTVQSNGDRLPFANGAFGSVISNSVLEHIVDVDAVVLEASRVLASPDHESGQAGGLLVLTVPSEHFTRLLSISMGLQRVGLDRAAAAYRDWFNHISRHYHCDPPNVWRERLATAGFRIVRWQYYFSANAHRRLEWGHFLGLPALVTRCLFGRWIIAPWRSSLEPVEQWLRPAFEEEPPQQGAYLFFIAQKMMPGEDAGPLPPPEPGTYRRWKDGFPDEPDSQPVSIQPPPENELPLSDFNISSSPVVETEPPVAAAPPVRSLVWLAAAILMAVIGQLGWNWQQRPMKPADGLTWYVLAMAAFSVFVWLTRGGSWRHLKGMISTIKHVWFRRHSHQIMLLLGALILSWSAWRQANQPINPGPLKPLITWIAGILLGIGALWPGVVQQLKSFVLARYQRADPDVRQEKSRKVRSWALWELAAVGALTMLAFLLRFIQLSKIPYVLSGDEANMGAEALRVLSGQLSNPFTTGWFSHPALYFYILAVPLKIVGSTTVALRFFSPFIGAATVLAACLLARRFFGRTVALTAGSILAGYHFHIHFSRLALNNIWDPFFALIVLGLLCLGWQSKDRRHFIAAGLGLGLSQYFYMGARMLLLLIAALLVYWLILDRRRLWQLRKMFLAMFLMALVVSLPIVVCSLQNPLEYFARMNQLGIFPSGWLEREIKLTGRGPTALLIEQLWKSALAFNYTIDPTFWYRPNIPLLRFWPSILFMFGLALCVFKLKKTPYFLLLLWIAETIFFAGFLLENPPSSQRYVIAAPAVAMLIAMALVWMLSRLREILGGRLEGWTVLLALLILWLVWGDVSFYFRDYTPSGDFGGINTETAQRVSDYLADLGSDWEAYFFGSPRMVIEDQGGFPTVPFLVPHVRRIDIKEPLENPGELAGLKQPAVFIFLPERAAEMQMIVDAFPGGQEKHFPGLLERILFISYEVE